MALAHVQEAKDTTEQKAEFDKQQKVLLFKMDLE